VKHLNQGVINDVASTHTKFQVWVD